MGEMKMALDGVVAMRGAISNYQPNRPGLGHVGKSACLSKAAAEGKLRSMAWRR